MATKLSDLSYLDYLSRANEEFLGQAADLIRAHVPKSQYERLEVKTGASKMTILHYDGTDGSDHLLDLGMSVHSTVNAEGREEVRIIVVGASALRGAVDVDSRKLASRVTPRNLFLMFKHQYGR
jgi:hypothetical protein